MPQGIVATVEDGFATLDFVDKSLRGPGLNRLLDIGGPATIETITRKGPRRTYRVPEGNARLAGLLDEAPRKLNVDGSPSNTEDGGTGITVTTGVDVGANDTGFATALENADPNTGSSISGADGPAAKGAVDWHTPTAEYTSENSFVGQVSNADVLHGRPQVFTGIGGGAGTDLAHPQTNAELIAELAANKISTGGANTDPGRSLTERVREPQIPAAHVNLALSQQPAALGSDPGGYARQPDEAPAAAKAAKGAKVEKHAVVAPTPPAPAPAEPAAPVADGRPAGTPEGVPDEDWKRAELNAFAEWKGVGHPEALANKAEVLAAIDAKG
jgi:hypothetical protein